MLSSIRNIRKYGVFQDFSSSTIPNLPDFRKFNLIYGWNYSGKTTLSRLFRALERKSSSLLPVDASFELVFSDTNVGINGVISRTNIAEAPAVRVFNRDYVHENFKYEHTAPELIVVGEENITLNDRRDVLKQRFDAISEMILDLESNRSYLVDTRNVSGTACARTISDMTHDRAFNRTSLYNLLEFIAPNPDKYILNEHDIKETQQLINSMHQFIQLSSIENSFPSIQTHVSDVNSLLIETASNMAIEHIKENRILESWIRTGLSLHKDKSTCEFCGNDLVAQRLSVLKDHFSDAYELLNSKIQFKIDELESISFNHNVPDDSRVVSNVKAAYARNVMLLNGWCGWANSYRAELILLLRSKQLSIEYTMDQIKSHDIWTIGNEAVAQLNLNIEAHNEVIVNLERHIKTATSKLKNHMSARYYKDTDLLNIESQIQTIDTQLTKARTLKSRYQTALNTVIQSINQSSIAVDKINKLLHLLLNDDNIYVKRHSDATFRFMRQTSPATDLSDGEKTAITFAYFITQLDESQDTSEEIIVFIDDPISSLDSSHVYAVYAIISKCLETYMQVIVSTHNSEFFNLLKLSWLNHRSNGNVSSGYHLVRREDNAEIRPLPKTLKKFQSEYEYIFEKLMNFIDDPNATEADAYTVPNILRKFLEAYLGFREPHRREWHSKLEILFDALETQERIHRFADDASHLQSMQRCLSHPGYLEEAKECVTCVMEALKIKDKLHYDSLNAILLEG
jgi:wobble nucleotide-excising tRNase